MIAKLVSLYDFENQEGLCSCKIGGGDFMLPKEWEMEDLSVENTLNKLYLIAAREKVKCSFDEYLRLIREEFSKITISIPEEELIINLRCRSKMEVEDIENGIKLGKLLIENKKNLNSQTNPSRNVEDEGR